MAHYAGINLSIIGERSEPLSGTEQLIVCYYSMEPPKAKKRKTEIEKEIRTRLDKRNACAPPTVTPNNTCIHVNCMYVHEDITSHYQHCFARPITLYKRFLVAIFSVLSKMRQPRRETHNGRLGPISRVNWLPIMTGAHCSYLVTGQHPHEHQ